MASRALKFVVGGIVPGSLVGWEFWANYERYQKEKRKSEKKKVTEGSMEWLVEQKVSTFDLVLRRRNIWQLGPLRGLASLAAPGLYDTVGIIIADQAADLKVLEADLDGSISFLPLSSIIFDNTNNSEQIIIRPLLWPSRNDKIEAAANHFATCSLLQSNNSNSRSNFSKYILSSFRAASDQRFAPLLRSSRTNWPSAPADASLPTKLNLSVSPAATLVLELYTTVGLIPPQYKGKAFLASDFASGDIPLRKGARFDQSSVISIKEANSAAPLAGSS